jgi:hypothetical protein
LGRRGVKLRGNRDKKIWKARLLRGMESDVEKRDGEED